MGDEIETRERIARLEVSLEHATKSIDAMAAKVSELHDLMTQAKGARWALVGLAGLSGAVAAFATKWVPFLQSIPPR